MKPEAIISCPVCLELEHLKFRNYGGWFVSEAYKQVCRNDQHKRFVARAKFIEDVSGEGKTK